jgi:hypothetical protein
MHVWIGFSAQASTGIYMYACTTLRLAQARLTMGSSLSKCDVSSCLLSRHCPQENCDQLPVNDKREVVAEHAGDGQDLEVSSLVIFSHRLYQIVLVSSEYTSTTQPS